MIGLDTNILARHYTQDDPVQSPLCTRFLLERCSETNPGWISVPVICELSWVLRKAYKYPKSDLLKILHIMRQTRGLQIEDEAAFDKALETYPSTSADFSDCLILARHQAHGVTPTYTLDTAASKLEGFVIIS